jgi:hypothetical protein
MIAATLDLGQFPAKIAGSGEAAVVRSDWPLPLRD